MIFRCYFIGSNILWMHISFEKVVDGPRVSISSQNKKITAARPPDLTANKGDACSLTIVANYTGPRISASDCHENNYFICDIC
jgi:hypothetical protein